eukprot:1158685-Pelagomonas_calceolata.AAC.2
MRHTGLDGTAGTAGTQRTAGIAAGTRHTAAGQLLQQRQQRPSQAWLLQQQGQGQQPGPCVGASSLAVSLYQVHQLVSCLGARGAAGRPAGTAAAGSSRRMQGHSRRGSQHMQQEGREWQGDSQHSWQCRHLP